MNSNAVWISWETHTRSRSLSNALSIPIYEIVVSGNRLYRYVVSIMKTFRLMGKKNPEVIFFQNPSIVLALILVLTRFIHKKKLIMDAHNAGVFPLEGRYRSLLIISRWLIQKVDLTIVTNNELAKVVSTLGGVAYIITDPIPELHCDSEEKESGRYPKGYILLICTWADDEPYNEVIKAMERLNYLEIELRITGNPPLEISRKLFNENIILEGFVSRRKYESLVCNSKLIIDLTTRKYCLVCGAYEAAAAGKPCILSDDKMARSVFRGGYLFTKNTEEAIAKSVENALNSLPTLEQKMRQFKLEYDSIMNKSIKEFKKTLNI